MATAQSRWWGTGLGRKKSAQKYGRFIMVDNREAVKVGELDKNVESRKVVKPKFTTERRCIAHLRRHHECGRLKTGQSRSGLRVEGLLEEEELARTALSCHFSVDLLCQKISDG